MSENYDVSSQVVEAHVFSNHGCVTKTSECICVVKSLNDVCICRDCADGSDEDPTYCGMWLILAWLENLKL